MTPTPVTVAVLTFRRPDDLARSLPVALAQVEALDPDRTSAELLVVDNDAGGSARDLVSRIGGARTRYVVEPTPGISAARNRALTEADPHGLLVFLDDDEVPRAGWLAALLTTAADTGAAAVAGPVVSTFVDDIDPWILAGGWFARAHRRDTATGERIAVAATNNLLLRMPVLHRLGLRFDATVGLSGGEDSRLTQALTEAGEAIVWCAGAVVEEPVPRTRSTRAYVRRRAMTAGNVEGAMLLEAARGRARLVVRARVAVRGAARVAAGLARTAAGTVTRSLVHRSSGARTTARGAGMLLAALGHVHEAYRRTDA